MTDLDTAPDRTLMREMLRRAICRAYGDPQHKASPSTYRLLERIFDSMEGEKDDLDELWITLTQCLAFVRTKRFQLDELKMTAA
mgnify:CR=1 FL=1